MSHCFSTSLASPVPAVDGDMGAGGAEGGEETSGTAGIVEGAGNKGAGCSGGGVRGCEEGDMPMGVDDGDDSGVADEDVAGTGSWLGAIAGGGERGGTVPGEVDAGAGAGTR
mmetsp:Transcript_68034/g.221486  ORF Transcript_68034/g.221486 Transcript_68034/m.221486 type:complete len:112 (+) Transcript_68034:195-530(+)